MESIKLPKETIAELKQHQRTLHDLIGELDKAEKCGADCQEMRRAHQEYHDRITAFLQHYA